MTKSRLTLSLDPRLQAGAVVLSARQGRRTIVHTVIDAAAAVTAPFEAIGGAGSDILSIRAGLSDDARTVSEAVAAAAGHMAVGLRFEDAPDASFAERCIDEGATYLAGSPLGLLTVDAAADAAATIEQYRRIDACAASSAGIPVVRELIAPMIVSPPEVLLAALLTDMVATAEAGVPLIVLCYPAMGSLVQDVAALNVLKSLGEELLSARGATARLVISVAHWTGEPDKVSTNRFAIASAASMAAGLSGADQVNVGALGGLRAATDGSLVDSVSTTRQMLDMLVDQRLEPFDQWRSERDAIDGAVREWLAVMLGEDTFAAALRLREVAPSWARRDALGMVRAAAEEESGAWPTWSGLPLPVVRERA